MTTWADVIDKGFENVKGYLDRSLDAFSKQISSISERIDAVEKLGPIAGEKGDQGDRGESGLDGVGISSAIIDRSGILIVTLADGRSQELGVVVGTNGVDGINGKDGSDGINGRDGVDGLAGKDGADGLNGKDGSDGVNGKDGVDGIVGKDGVDGKDGRDGIDGKSVDMDVVKSLIEEAVSAAVATAISAIPAPKDGKDGADGKDGIDGINGLNGKDGSDGRNGTDGIGLAGAMIDRSGELVITMTNGEAKTLGPVIGKDGTDGVDGAIGQDGKDGFGLDDFDATLMEDGRTVLLSFDRGDQSFKVELGFPVMIYRGVFKDGETYEVGDTVTWGGSLWHCRENTSDKPETTKAWTLAAKRGRDGKDGTQGERGIEGKAGAAGKDLTQLGQDGSKW